MSSRPVQSDGRVHGVVGALRRKDDRWLLIRRSDRVIAPNKVCFPGGAIEIGEPHRHALRREMMEEVGVDVEPVRCCWRWDSPAAPLTLWGWIANARNYQVKPNPMEVSEILWLTLDEAVAHRDAIATNVDFVRCLKADQLQPIDLLPQ